MLTLKRPALHQSQPKPKPPMPQRQLKDASTHEDEIRPLAYRKWEEAGRPEDDGVQFWLAAEKQILRGRRS